MAFIVSIGGALGDLALNVLIKITSLIINE